MAGRQAKTVSDNHVKAALKAVQRNRYPERDRVILLLSVKAGLRAGEIAKLTWPMVCDASGDIGRTIELYDIAAKKCSGRTIPIPPALKNFKARPKRSIRRVRIHAESFGIGMTIPSSPGATAGTSTTP